MKRTKLKLSFLALLLASAMQAQTPEQRQEIIKDYDVEALQQLADRFDSEYKENYALALKIADEKGWPLKIVNDEFEAELFGVSDEGYPLYNRTFNQGSAITSRSNHLNQGGSLGLNLQGQDMNVGVWDQNHPLLTHNDFQERAFVLDGSGVNASFHSTHVTGTIIASGTNNASGRGIAPMAYGWVNDWNNDFGEMAQQAAFGLLISNHSYGLISEQIPLYYFGAYINLSRSVDEVTFAAPGYQPVYAAGNDRDNWSSINPGKGQNDLLAGRATSKNAITVAAVNQVSNYVSASSVSMSGFSNYGPTDDFRIKPDISAKGVGVISTSNSNNTSYSSSNGTSMAAPGVSGVLTLLQQHHNNLHSSYMLAATLKGIMIHTADEAGPAEGPDHMFGWGLINAKKSAEMISGKNINAIVDQNTLTNGQTFTRTVLATGNEPLVVTVIWTDRPGTINNGTIDLSTPTLVNDLDVRVTRNGVTYEPWRLTKNFASPLATRGDNNVDNVEKIEVTGTQAGNYEITITHKGNLVGGSQNYSLLVSGISDPLSTPMNDLVNKIDVFPNPAIDKLNFFIPNEITASQIELYDIQGRRVLSRQLLDNSSGNIEIDINDLSSGIYVVSIGLTNGMKINKKVVKK